MIRLEHTPAAGGARVRAFFLGEPIDDTPLKSTPDAESLGAAWVSLDELDRFPLRGREVEGVLRYVAAGGSVYPLSVLQAEHMPFKP